MIKSLSRTGTWKTYIFRVRSGFTTPEGCAKGTKLIPIRPSFIYIIRLFLMIKSLSRTGTWKTYSIDHGLPSLRIEHIAEDSEGYIWFATRDNGASRFDGDEFQNFTTQDGLAHGS